MDSEGATMLGIHENRWKTLCYHLFFIGLVVYGPMADLASSQTQFQNPQGKKNILILNAFESNIPAFEKTNQGLSSALRAGGIGIRNQFFESLDMVRNPGLENIKLLKQLICQRYCKRKIDLIITLYPEGLQFLLDMDPNFFPEVPILALFLPKGFELPQTDRRIIPHVVIPDLKRTIEISLKLVPKAKRIYVVGGIHPLDRWLEKIAQMEFKKWERQLDFEYLSDLPLEKIITTVSAVPSNSIVFITAFSQDVTGKYQTTVELSRQLSQVSKAPVFGFLGTLLGNGIAGGSLLNFEYIGTKAGEMALEILNRTENSANNPTMLEVPQLDSFDWIQLKHWNLSESDLPKGSIIVNREFSLWDLRYYAIGVLAFIMAQSLLIVGLLIQKRRRRLAEESLRHHREELAHVSRIATMGELTTSLAHEINQPLTAILSNAEAALRFLSRTEPDIDEVRQILEDIIRDDRRADNVMQSVRDMVRKEKHHEELLDLNKVIQGVVELIRDDSLLDGLSIFLDLTPEVKMIRGNRVQLQQVILNLILNSADAMSNTPRAQRKILVKTAMPTNRTVRVSVTDFGPGIDANKIERLFEAFYTTKPQGLGMGLSISQTIIDAHGGNIEASNNLESGVTFIFTLPTDQGDSS
jgi:signal transduction histidine kinase